MNVRRDSIPVELRKRTQWVLWKRERRRGKDGQWKWTKVPYQPACPRVRAKVDDPATWGTFEQAIDAVRGFDGVGYVFAADDPYAGIDFDACIDEETGELHLAVAEILEQLDSYWERSPSRTGVHVIVAGELHSDRNVTEKTSWGDKFEVYDQRRYFTITGEGDGTIRDCQAELDALVARMLGEVSGNGAGPNRSSIKQSKVDVQEILDQHDDLAKIASRKSTKPKGGTPSDWDYMLGARAAEHGYGDAVLAALIRHSRRMHGEDKGERDDYVERTVAAIRRQVGHVGGDVDRDVVLSELTKALRLYEVGRRAVATYVAGHGNTAVASILLDDGYSIEFPSFAHVAQPGKLADQLATTVGIATDFNKLQSRRIAALVRRAASRGEEVRDHEVYVDEAVRLLRLAQTIEFEYADQASKWETWAKLDETDPEETPEGPRHETSAQRRNRENKTAETFARRVLIPIDRQTGVWFVPAGWLQQFMRLRLGASTTPQRTRQAMLRAGLRVRGRDGRNQGHGSGRRSGTDLRFLPRAAGLGGASRAR